MCTYAVARFSCRHEIWGRRTKLCTIGEDFRDGQIEADCTVRGTHPLKTMAVPEPCYDCFKIKALSMLCREKLQQARSVFKERWPEELPPNQANPAAAGEHAAQQQEQEIPDQESPQRSDIKEQVIECPPDVNAIAKSTRVLRKIVKPGPTTKEPATPLRKCGLPAPKTTPPAVKTQTALPAPKVTPSKITPPRASRLAVPVKKTPEKSDTPVKASTKTPTKLGTKLPKPEFLRK